jgi:HTH-type transcriptional regulator / antitoxin HigA
MIHDPIHIIHTEDDYKTALEEYESYFEHEPAPGSEAADRFELLGMVLAKYEAERHPVPDASPIEVLQFMMDATGKTQSDLADLFESRSRASEVLSGRRELSLNQIRLLAKEWHIPASALIGELETA